MDALLIALVSIIFLSIGSLTSVLIHRLILMEFQKTDINLFFPPAKNCTDIIVTFLRESDINSFSNYYCVISEDKHSFHYSDEYEIQN